MAKFSRSEIRSILSEAGIADENTEAAVTKLVRLHLDVVEPLKSENDTISGKDKTIEKLNTQLETVTNELETLKKEDYKAKYEALTAEKEKLKAEYDAYKGEQATKAAKAAKEKAIRDYFKSKGDISENNLEIVMRGVRDEIDAAEVTDKGIKDTKPFDALIGGIYADMYKHTTTTGTVTPTPPEQGGGSTFEKMSLADKMQFANEKPNDPAVKAWLQG